MTSILFESLAAGRDLGRLHDIAAVLIRYGFGDVVRRMGLGAALERAGRALHWKEPEALAHLEPPARVRRALEDMGPTFIKLGQILSTRVDLFGPEWIAEFQQLQDHAVPVAWADLQAQVHADLGDDPAVVFKSFDTTPLAVGSIAQVHGAQLADGAEVVVKIRRPDIRRIIEADLRLLTRLAEIAESEAPELARYRPREVVRQFTLSLRRELDLAAECRNAERIAKNFAEHPEIVVPSVYWEWTSERLNVQQRIEGIAGRDLAGADAAGLDRKLLARRGANAVLKMMLEDGFFHADPHPGNVFYLNENRVAFIDFGMVGRLSEARRDQVVALLQGLVGRDAAEVADVLIEWSDGAATDLDRLRNEIDKFVDDYHSVPLKELDLGAMLGDVTGLLRDHGLTLPADLAMMVKAFISLEGMGRQIDPDFQLGPEAGPFLKRAIFARYAPDKLAKRGWRSIAGAAELLASLPRDVSQLLRAARRGNFKVQVEVKPLEKFGEQIDRAAARLTIGLVTAAMIIGTSILMTVGAREDTARLSTFVMLGLVVAFGGGLWVLLSIWRGKKNKR